MRPAKDAIALLEAAYSLEGDADAWLAQLAAHAGIIDDGLGVLAYRLRGDIRTIDAFASTNPHTLTKEVLLAAADALPKQYHEALFPTRAVSTLSERLEQPLREHPLYDVWFRPAGIEDAVAVVAADGTDAMLVLSAPVRHHKVMSARERARLDRVAIHVGAANRLRDRFRREGLKHLDAVLAPDGKVLEASGDAAEPEARAHLRDRARAIDRARTRETRANDLDALELWQGLVTGRWSLCDHFDTDGRRFVIVRENEPNATPRTGFTQREAQLLDLYARGQSQKLIAYELGLTPAVVSQGLRDVAARFGASDLAELAAIAATLFELRSRTPEAES